MDVVLLGLQLFGGTITGVLAVLGILGRFTDDNHAITRAGRRALVLAIVSAFLSLATRAVQFVVDSHSAARRESLILEQVTQIDHLRNELDAMRTESLTAQRRSEYPLKAPIHLSLSLMLSPQESAAVKKFVDDLAVGVEKFISNHRYYNNETPDEIYYIGALGHSQDPRGYTVKPTLVRIVQQSSLFPRSEYNFGGPPNAALREVLVSIEMFRKDSRYITGGDLRDGYCPFFSSGDLNLTALVKENEKRKDIKLNLLFDPRKKELVLSGQGFRFDDKDLDPDRSIHSILDLTGGVLVVGIKVGDRNYPAPEIDPVYEVDAASYLIGFRLASEGREIRLAAHEFDQRTCATGTRFYVHPFPDDESELIRSLAHDSQP